MSRYDKETLPHVISGIYAAMLNVDMAQSSKIMNRIGDAARKLRIFPKKLKAMHESKSSMDASMVGTLVSRTGSTGSRQASTSSAKITTQTKPFFGERIATLEAMFDEDPLQLQAPSPLPVPAAVIGVPIEDGISPQKRDTASLDATDNVLPSGDAQVWLLKLSHESVCLGPSLIVCWRTS